MGGDEFLVLFDDVSGEAAAELGAIRLVEELSRPMEIGGQRFQLSASAGVALFPEDAEDLESLTHAGDQAMYAAKRSRGSVVRLHSGIGWEP
jgi:diguanylate cyclase (GGDEF)-like protein